MTRKVDPPVTAMPAEDVRRPRSVYRLGEEPDPRFTLANERTLLAWLRTALALVATGVALIMLSDHFEVLSVALTMTAAIASALTGGVTAIVAFLHWQSVERALRLRRPLPSPSAMPIVIAAVLGLAAIALVAAISSLA
jgi:inner membrane protein YidH